MSAYCGGDVTGKGGRNGSAALLVPEGGVTQLLLLSGGITSSSV